MAARLGTSTLDSGRYCLFDELGAGGMGRVRLGVARGALGITRLVAVKMPHADLARDPSFRRAFVDEARTAARVRHPNVVELIEVVDDGETTAIVMEHVLGVALSKAMGEKAPLGVASALVCDMLRGLQAAHEAKSADGLPLGVVHRDIAPSNILVGADGHARVIDFGIATSALRSQVTRDGAIRGRVGYCAPERFRGMGTSTKSDLWSVGVILWELLAGEPLFEGTDVVAMSKVLGGSVPSIVPRRPDARAVGGVLDCALAQDPRHRFASAVEMAVSLATAAPPAEPETVARWLEEVAGTLLAKQRSMAEEAEAHAAELTVTTTEKVGEEAPAPPRVRWSPLVVAGAASIAGIAAAAFFAGGDPLPTARTPRAADVVHASIEPTVRARAAMTDPASAPVARTRATRRLCAPKSIVNGTVVYDPTCI